jgi:NTE family protein
MQTAALWRFSRRYMGDYRVGLVIEPHVRLAVAVAASSAFPPFLSPMILKNAQPVIPTKGADLNKAPYTERVVLSDGGVYDNHGLETAFKRYKTLLVSDGGQKIANEERPSENWAGHSLRVLDVVDNQVRSLRRRMLIEAYENESRAGAYWGIGTRYAAYRLTEDPLGCAARDPSNLAAIPTRLEAMPAELQNRLINWGYAVCDAALRKHVTTVGIAPPNGFPKPGGY